MEFLVRHPHTGCEGQSSQRFEVVLCLFLYEHLLGHGHNLVAEGSWGVTVGGTHMEYGPTPLSRGPMGLWKPPTWSMGAKGDSLEHFTLAFLIQAFVSLDCHPSYPPLSAVWWSKIPNNRLVVVTEKQQSLLLCPFLLSKLSLVIITPLRRNQRTIFIFSRTFNFQIRWLLFGTCQSIHLKTFLHINTPIKKMNGGIGAPYSIYFDLFFSFHIKVSFSMG
jgi:hypothetical protein